MRHCNTDFGPNYYLFVTSRYRMRVLENPIEDRHQSIYYYFKNSVSAKTRRILFRFKCTSDVLIKFSLKRRVIVSQ